MTHSALPDFDPLWQYDDPAGTEQRFRDLLPSARRSGNVHYHAELLTQIARAQGLQRQFDDAHQTLDEAHTLLPRAGDRAKVRYLLERGRVLNSSRHPEESLPYFEEALQLGQECGEEYHAVDAAHMIAIVEQPVRQITWNLRALELAKGCADQRARDWQGALYNNLGWSYHNLGRYEEALAAFRQGLEYQQRAGKPRDRRIAAWTVARAMRSLGRYEEALQLQRENLQRLQEAGEMDGFVQEELGECLLALGREEEARDHFARAHAGLSSDPWLRDSDPERLDRLARLGEVST